MCCCDQYLVLAHPQSHRHATPPPHPPTLLRVFGSVQFDPDGSPCTALQAAQSRPLLSDTGGRGRGGGKLAPPECWLTPPHHIRKCFLRKKMKSI